MLSRDDFECDECDGEGDTKCPTCGQESSCDVCDGYGLDSDKIDVKAFEKAKRQFYIEHGNTVKDWKIENVVVGYKAETSKGCLPGLTTIVTLAYETFATEEFLADVRVKVCKTK